MRLVYLSPVPWASFAQRPHKFVEWFHRQHGAQVLWVDPYPTRFPTPRDLLRLKQPSEPVEAFWPKWLTVKRSWALPLEPLPGSGWVNQSLWRGLLKDIGGPAVRDRHLLVIGKPSVLALYLLKTMRWSATAYDAMDNFPAFYSGWSRFSMAQRERQVVKGVGEVWTSSTMLRERWLRLRPEVQLVHNGLDSELMPVRRRPQQRVGARVFGYVGTIAGWFDWPWVQALAQARPDDVIRLIGPVFASPPDTLPANIEMLPSCSHARALEAMQSFDVGLIPFRCTELTEAVDPIKYYEYRALGLPVLSTDFGEMRYRAQESGVFISAGLADIATRAAAAEAWVQDEAERVGFMAVNTWNVRFDQVRHFA